MGRKSVTYNSSHHGALLRALVPWFAIALLGSPAVLLPPTPAYAADTPTSRNTASADKLSTLTPAQRRWLADQGVLTYCITSGRMPYEQFTSEGKAGGIVSEILSQIALKLQTRIEWVKANNIKESMNLLRSGRCDLLSVQLAYDSKASLDHEQQLNYSQPLVSYPSVVVTRIDAPLLADISELNHKPVGIVRDSPAQNFLESHHPELNLILMNSTEDGLRLLRSGGIYAMVDSLAAATYFINKQVADDLKISAYLNHHVSIALASSPDQGELNTIINTGISLLPPGLVPKITNKWTMPNSPADNFSNFTWKAIALCLAGLLLLVIRSRKPAEKHLDSVHLSEIDPLTRLMNRFKLDQALEHEYHRSLRTQTPFSIILMNVDHFKSINDQHGQEMGDKMLIQFSEVLSRTVRKIDLVGKWCGQDFMIICPDTPLQGAKRLAEKIRREVSACQYPVPGNFSASFGVAEFRLGSSISELVNKAGLALLTAKEGGRNRVVADDQPSDRYSNVIPLPTRKTHNKHQ